MWSRYYSCDGWSPRCSSNDFGLFGLPKANILVGPEINLLGSEADSFGRVGIDMIAGPTNSLIIADEFADAEIAAADAVGQEA